ncbi:hypothetical protein CHS0354_002836 [Potamilus streckersoni]|uniref:Uncharacterized protein n=1 Tax=Potamilus streckersoni TaxID=2493646 RepID=A0AAE0RMF7_9BIVA|nr:hypothetical protein CHS0354_002836 [Potamilus streckersoni]
MSRHVFLENDICYRKKKILEDITQPHLKNAEEGLKALLRQFDGKHNLSNVYSAGETLSSRENSAFYNRWITDQARQLKKSYEVEVAVLIDESVWNLYSPLVHALNPAAKEGLVKRKIREAYSHIMNGVNLRYKTIDDPEISISIKLRDFIFFQVTFCSAIDVDNINAEFGHFKQILYTRFGYYDIRYRREDKEKNERGILVY